MAWWITVYCTKPVAHLTGEQLLMALRDGDPEASAGVDYHTLAEDYDVPDDQVSPALEALHTKPNGELPIEVDLGYSPDGRPLTLHCWTEPARVAEELAEAREVRSPPSQVEDMLDTCVEIAAIELGASQVQTMGIVLAYELARYLAQKGDGPFVDDEDEWWGVNDGALVEL